MRILALDTASDACSVAIWSDGAILAHRFAIIGRGHAEALIPMVEETMSAGQTRFQALDLLATTIGPGTFTGLRVGLAAARGLALAGGLPLAGVTTLEALARGAVARPSRPVVAALDARRGEIYFQAFGPDIEALAPPRAATPESAANSLPKGKLLVVGNAAEMLARALHERAGAVELGPPPGLPDAVHVALICADRYGDGGQPMPNRPPSPMYLRDPGIRQQGTPRP